MRNSSRQFQWGVHSIEHSNLRGYEYDNRANQAFRFQSTKAERLSAPVELPSKAGIVNPSLSDQGRVLLSLHLNRVRSVSTRQKQARPLMALKRPRVNARLMPEAEPRRRFQVNISGGLSPCCTASLGFGEKGVGGYEVGGVAPVLS